MGLKEKFFPPKGLSKKDLEMAEIFGGSDIDTWEEYETPDCVPSFDKGGHKERSIANNPSHLKHWKNQKTK